MEGDVLHFLICSTYKREFKAIIQAQDWKNIVLHTFPQACRHPELRKQAAEKIREYGGQYDQQALLVCECFALPETAQLGLQPSQVRHLDQCFYLLTNRLLVDHFMAQGAYLLTPGWLDSWRAHLERWGFDQDTARKFFQESTRKLVLLDTLANPHSLALLQEMGTYLGLPVESLPIGTDYLQLYLSEIIAEKQYKSNQQSTKAAIAELNRNSADYAMAFDLLTSLNQITNEAEAVETILDLFTMLFSPGTISYCPVVENVFGAGTECQQDEEGRRLLQRWALEKSEDYSWTSSGNGFFLRFQFRSETIGVLCVDDIKLPQYKHQYLNLALSIAHLCGLSISNARTFQRLQEAETTARWEKEISETLRGILSELTLQRDLDKLLERILVSLARITPYSVAAISLLDGAQLIFMAGNRFSPDGRPVAFPAPSLPLSLESIQPQDPEALIDVLRSSPMIQEYLGGGELLSWINLPLVLRGVLVGFLSMGNRLAQVYSAAEVGLAQSFADEVSIAIENARLFKEIQTLAIIDGLTGLYNRRHFYHLANLEFMRSSRYNRPLSLLMIDVDLFKRINDTYGHQVGDRALNKIARDLLKNRRSGDIAGRFGGEEFTILLPETNQASALVVAERLRLLIAETPLEIEQGSVALTISLGVATKDIECENMDELLRRSDEALYAAKNAGRNCVKVWAQR